jgi:glycosyltransferase involved in cell wall biosynthesis
MKTGIMVSVYCLAYNHERYIRKALEGFVNQKTDFSFEVFVHDDASTDKTASIIEEYHKKYPEIIKPIYETENQFSKIGAGIIKTILRPLFSGKYIAICEGDDYWCDELKLQKQVDYMECHPDCTLCVTNGYIHYENSDKMDDFVFSISKNIPKAELKDSDFDVGGLVDLYVPAASFLFPRSNYLKFPKSYERYCFGADRKLAMYCCALGYCHFINDKTCVYNRGVPNSETTRKKSREESIIIAKGYFYLYQDINSITNYEYSSIIESKIIHWQKILLFMDYKEQIKNPFAKMVCANLGIIDRLRLIKNRLFYANKR